MPGFTRTSRISAGRATTVAGFAGMGRNNGSRTNKPNAFALLRPPFAKSSPPAAHAFNIEVDNRARLMESSRSIPETNEISQIVSSTNVNPAPEASRGVRRYVALDAFRGFIMLLLASDGFG